jgi:prepilin-type processing-associated H-X9-DG protein
VLGALAMNHKLIHATSLIELLVVLAVIGLIISLLLPAVQQVRARSDRLLCQSRQRQIGVAMHHCQADTGAMCPVPLRQTAYSAIPSYPNIIVDKISWMARLLPYVEGDSVHKSILSSFALSPNPLHDPPHAAKSTVIKTYTCSSDARISEPFPDYRGEVFAYTSFIGIDAVLSQEGKVLTGFFGMSKYDINRVRDGTSNTLLISERPPSTPAVGGWWYPGYNYDGYCRGPNTIMHLGSLSYTNPPCDNCILPRHGIGPGRIDNICDRYHLWSLHGNGINILFVDGSVRYMSYKANTIVDKIVSVDNGEIVDMDLD